MKYHNILLVILLAISEYLITGAPTTSHITLPADDTLSTVICNDSPAWSGPSFNPRDCATAISKFFAQELLVHEDAILEFQCVGAHAQSRYPPQMTPQKFTYGELLYMNLPEMAKCILSIELQETANSERSLVGTCTMAIVMLASFFPEELPGIPGSRVFSLVDVASYKDVWNAVKRVMDNCISKYLAFNETMQDGGGGLDFRSATGWSAVGKLHLSQTSRESVVDVRNVFAGRNGDIGVFIWETDSPIDRRTDPINPPGDGLRSSLAPLRLMNLTQPGMVKPLLEVI